MLPTRKYILASASPRRHEILTTASVPHEVITADADEKTVVFLPGRPGEYTESIAKIKNDAVCRKIELTHPDAVVISADTIVYLPDTDSPIGKPKDKNDAVRILTALSGTTHEVVTGVVIRDLRSGREICFHETTAVKFRSASADEIQAYADSGDPMDKAGAYGVQSGGCIFVESISGDWFNVMGLPICRLYAELCAL